MKLFTSIGTTTLMAISIALNSCSQSISKNSSGLEVFQATTPCNEAVKSLLGIPATTKCDMMKWNLTLYHDSGTLVPSSFKLSYTYGLPKQGTRGFMEGASTNELKGKCIIAKGTRENPEAVVYQLTGDDVPVSLFFFKPNENLLHLLDRDKNLMVGNGAWSYTLNATNPIKLSSNKFNSQKIAFPVFPSDSAVFDGRTPCYEPLLALSGRSTAGCQLIKCRLVLYRDAHTHEPANFLLYTIHVGTGGTRFPTTGTWRMIRGTKSNPEAVLFQLQPNSNETLQPLVFLKGDDNILFLLDSEMNYMAGNDYCAYTLNRIRK